MTSSDHVNHGGGKKRKHKDNGDDQPDVALEQLQMNTLRYYEYEYHNQPIITERDFIYWTDRKWGKNKQLFL